MLHKRIIHLGVLSALVAGLALVAWGPAPVHAQPVSQTTTQTRLHVYVSFSILADVAAQVAGDAASVDSLIPRGTNPHGFEPSAQDVVALSDADLVLTVGLNFEESLGDVIAESAQQVRSVSDCIPVRAVVEGVLTGHDHAHDSNPTDDHAEEMAEVPAACTEHHAQVEGAFQRAHLADDAGVLGLAAEGVCDAGGCDPHVWTDPINVALWALAIRDELSVLDPANADTYAANAAAYLDELAALDAEISAMIDTIPPEHRVIVTNHLAFDYFASHYGLDLVGVVIPGGSTSAEPSVQDVIALIETIKSAGVPAIFTETTVSDSLAQQIASESGAAVVPLYTGSLSDTDGPAATYGDYLRYNATQIVGALQ